MQSANRGILYVATKLDRYVEEAFLSATSVKEKAPEIPIALFTDKPTNPLCACGAFDRIESIATQSGFRSEWTEGQFDRLNSLTQSPFDYTLQLDTDTRVFTAEIRQLFDLLDNLDVAAVEEDPANSISAKLSKRRMFNAGFILYRRTETVWEWLHEWRRTTEQNFRLAVEKHLPEIPELAHIEDEETKRLLLSIDQIALMQLLSPDVNRFGLALRILDQSWNYRGSNRGPDIRILHADELKTTTIRDILKLAGAWADRNDPRAEELYRYVADRETGSALPRKWWMPWRAPRNSEAWATANLKKADLHLRYGQTDRAVNLIFREDSAAAVVGVARAEMMHGRFKEAVALAQEAASRAPRSPYVNAILGQALLTSGNAEQAIEPLTIAARKGYPGSSFYLGQAWFAVNNYQKAADAYRAAVTEAPIAGRNNLVMALLGLRKYRHAAAVTDELLAITPWHAAAIAFRAVAQAEMGKAPKDLDHSLIETGILEPPPDYKNLQAFNRALAEEIMREPSLIFQPAGHATRYGFHTSDLSASKSPAVRALNEALVALAQRRLDAIPDGSPHLFHRAAPRRYKLYAWAVAMQDQGHQTPHIHAQSWLSGVYYVDVPGDMDVRDPDCRGWLEFGQSEERWHKAATLPNRKIFPEPGLYVTFPGYFWHNTRPLRSRNVRISYAFDIVPA